jgi:LacI family transcriptional regulator
MDRRTSNLPSLADVAAAANVSIATVSRVLNDNHKSRIARATKVRVRLAAEELGYRPNLFARSLLGIKTRTLGLIMSTFENPFFAGVARSAWQHASENNYHILLEAQSPSMEPMRNSSMFASWPVDGLILWADSSPYAEWLIERGMHGMPTVYMGSLSNETNDDMVSFDFYAGMLQILGHIEANGYRNPVMIVPPSPECAITDPRYVAYCDYCATHNIPVTVIRLPENQAVAAAGFQLGMSLASKPAPGRPDVAICYNDQVAISVSNGFRRAGLRIPNDIAVTGFDGINEGQFTDQPLTTAAIPLNLACAAAIEILIHRIEGKPNDKPNQITLPVRLIPGATT